jgi:microcystin-dependent protein
MATAKVGNIKGPPGQTGPTGVNAYTLTIADFVLPAIGASVQVTVQDASWITIGQMVAVQTAGGSATIAYSLRVTAKTGNLVTLQNIGNLSSMPLASATGDGLLRKVSGSAADYVGGDNACHPITPLPTGATIDFAGSVAPSGFLMCDGSAVSRTTYAALFGVLGTTWGPGDGSTTFNVPDMRGRVVIGSGQGVGLINRLLAALGGEESHQLTIAELAAHTHVQNAHTHNYRYVGTDATTGDLFYTPMTGTAFRYTAANPTSSVAAVNQNNGSDTPHNNMPPFAVMNKIIKT